MTSWSEGWSITQRHFRLKLKTSPVASRALALLSFITACFIIYKLLVYLFITDISYHTEWRACPACYGTRMCPRIHQTSVHGKEGYHHINSFTNIKNIYFGKLNTEELVFKKLAHDDEISAIDSYICHGGFSACSQHLDSNHKFCVSTDTSTKSNTAKCDLNKAVSGIASQLSGPLVVEEVKGLGDAMHCPSTRLVQRMVHRYQERGELVHENGLSKEEKLMLLYTLSVNPEPIILQLFPHDEGWPFPKYIGACGRMIAEENGGVPLRNYFHADWKTRVRLSLKLLSIADHLTDNSLGFKLYFSDVSLDNYVVNDKLDVIIADAENIVIVDEQQVEADRSPGYDKLHVSQYDSCDSGTNCLSMDINALCSTTLADFNYYAVCKSLLSGLAQDEEGMKGGLLHSLPQTYPESEAIDRLAKQCANPPANQSRIVIKDKLIRLLEKFISSF